MKLLYLIMAVVLVMLCFFVYSLINETIKINNWTIPSEYVLVKYDEKDFVIMDSSRQKFLIYWDDETHGMKKTMGNLKGGELELKRHLMDYLEELQEQNKKLEIQERLKKK